MSSLAPNSSTVSQPGSKLTSASLTYSQVQNYWVQAGGNPQASAMAAAIADATSGLNPNFSTSAANGQPIVGLWGIVNGSSDPLANARLAVQQSNNGTDWTGWCSAWSDNACGSNGGTYLGDGSNALGALGQTGAYNVIGSSPTGAGTSASSATSTGTPVTSSSTSKTIFTIILLIALIVAIYYFSRRASGQNSEESQNRSQASWSPEEEAAILDSTQTDKQISAITGRSIRSIRVRRNQIKSR